jgi:hypothetical protein
MRLLKRAILLLLPLILLFCSSGEPPEKIARKFIQCMNEKDFSGAKKLCTEETRELLDIIAVMTEDREYQMDYQNIRISKDDPYKAICSFKYNDIQDHFVLLKKRGIWKVHLDINK